MTNQKQLWKLAGKISIALLAIAAYFFIAGKLITFPYWHALLSSVKFSSSLYYFALLLLVLWCGNLLSEALKWKALLQPIYPISTWKSLQQVLAGTTTAVGSPGRIAEMGGRIALLPKEHRLNAGILTGIGGLLQNLVIFTIGGIALFHPLSPAINFINNKSIVVALFVFVLIIALLIIAGRLYGFQKLRILITDIGKIKCKQLVWATIWTFVRYCTYIIQLFCWMQLFGLQISVSEILIYAPVYFFIITIIPSYILFDVGIRGSAALLVFSTMNISEPLVLAAILCQWISNVVLPTLIGTYILLRQKVYKQEVMQKET